MAVADTSDARIAIVKETVLGVNPGVGAVAARITSDSLKSTQGREKSEEVTGDRNPRQNLRVEAASEGDLNFEFSANNFDEILEGTLQEEFPATPAVMSGTITAAAAGQTFTSNGSSPNLSGILKGQWFRISGFTNAANNGVFRAAVDSTATTLTAEAGSGIVNEAGTGNEEVEVSQMIRIGTDLQSFTIERQWQDIDVYEMFTGMVVASLTLNIAVGTRITGTASFMGLEPSVDVTPQIGTVAPAGTETIATAVDNFRGVKEASFGADSPICITEMTLTLDNQTRMRRCADDLYPFSIGLGVMVVGMTFTAFLENKEIYEKYLNNTPTMISFRIEDVDDNVYVFTIPRARIVDYEDPIGGNSQDGFMNVTIDGETDADGVGFQIDKFVSPGS